MKKVISVILVLCLMLSLSVAAFAAELTPTADKTSINAGDDVTVTLAFNEKIENVVTIAYKVYFDSDLFTYKSKTDGNVAVSTSTVQTNATGTYMTVSTMDTTFTGQTLEGKLCDLTFTAKTSVAAEKAASFSVEFERGLDNTGATISHTAGAAASVTVSPAGEELTLYGRIYGKNVNSEFADLTGTGNGVEYVCRDIEKKTGLDVIKGVLGANGYTYVVEGNAVTSVTDPNGVTLTNGDAAYGPKSAWVTTINGTSLADNGITSLAEYIGGDGDEFVLTFTECPGSATGKHTFGTDGKCTVCGMEKAQGSYTLTMPADKTAKAGEAVAIPVELGHTGDETTFHAADMVFTYDADKLTYVSVDVPDNNCSVDAATAGTIHVQAYGEAKNLGTAFTLNFTTKADASGTADVKVTSAKIDKSANAVAKDAPEATLEDDLTVITIKATHNVTLPDIFDGEKTVEDGADYTFSKTDKDESHYEYSDVKATVNGKNVEVVDNGDGTYTVKNVTGDLTVTGKRTAKKYKVTVDGNAASCIGFADTASYGTDYGFTANDLDTDKYGYTLTMTIGGKSHTPEFDDLSDMYLYTIKGENIVGDIHITFTQTEKAPATTQVTFTGSGVSDVQGGNPQTATTGKDFTFTIKKDTNYDYTVKLGDEELTEADGKYTIPGAKITGTPLTVTVEKTFSAKNVNVQKYVNLENQTSVWLVTVAADPGANNVFTYGGAAMYKTTKYADNGTYAYLVIAQTLTKEEAAAQLGITAGEPAGTVDYSCDVNGSGATDINDAQLVYDLYNAHYADFTTVTMYKFLCADVSDSTPEGATLLNVNDAVAVIDQINKQ